MTQIIATNNWWWKWGGGWEGDMLKSVYDPQNIGKDAFDYDNFTNTPTIPVVPTEISAFDNDAWYITSSDLPDLSGYQLKSNLVTNLTSPDDTHYPSAKAVSDAITSAWGWDMLKATYDPNNIWKDAFDYDNFINTPTIPAAQIQSDWNEADNTKLDYIKNKPTIPTVNNSTIEIQENWTKVKDFTLNQSSWETINITVPTKVSDLSNDSWFITWITSGDVTTALWYTPVNPSSLGTAASKDTWTSSWNVPVLDSNGKLNTSTLPWVALTDTFTVTNKSDLTSLSSAEQWDIWIVTSESKTYVLSQAPYSTLSNWKELLSPTDAVTSVNGQTWAVTLDADDISDSTTTNKFVTASEKSTWSWKQDALTAWSNISITTSWWTTTIAATDTTYNDATQSTAWLMSAADKTKLDWIASWATANIWTITSVKMNWSTVASSWEADLWTVVTSVKTINSNSITWTWNLSITEWHDYSWQYLQVQLNNAQISWTKYRCLVLAGANLNITAGSGLTPGMEYILEVNNIAGADINMNFDWVSHNVPNWKSRFFRFICINSTSLSYDGSFDELSEAIAWKQATLVSWTNIKTVNSNSLLGSGNISLNEFNPWWTATTWYVVTKTADGYEWAQPTGWISLDSNSPITVSKLWVGTEQQYSALWSYDASTIYMTV